MRHLPQSQILKGIQDKNYGSAQGFFDDFQRLREGKQTQDDITVLKSRILKSKPGEPNYPASLTHVFSTNASVNAHNEAVYNLSQSEKAQIDAIDVVVGDISDELKHEVKKKVPDDPSKQWAYTKI